MKSTISIFIYIFSFLLLSNPLYAYSMSVGDEVKMVASSVAVRDIKSTNGTNLGRLPLGTIGKVLDGPDEGSDYIWSYVQWDNGITGWTPNPKSQYFFYEKPTLTSPGRENRSYEEITDTTPTLRWQRVDGVINYRIALRDVATQQLVLDKDIDGSLTSYTHTSTLTKGHKYYWNILPRDGDGDKGLWSASLYFKIQDNTSTSDLRIRSEDITIRSRSGPDNIININEEFDVRVNVYNAGASDSESYRINYYYGGTGSNFSSFSSDTDGGIDAGEWGGIETSSDEDATNKAGTHYVKVCVEDTDTNDPVDNDCAVRSFEVQGDSSSTPDTPVTTSITPTQVTSSFYNRYIVITGTNFSSNSIVEHSLDGINYSAINVEATINNNSISFSMPLISFDSNNHNYFRVRNDSSTSNAQIIDVEYTPPTDPRLFYINDSTRETESGTNISFEFTALDLDDLINKQKNYTCKMDWGDGTTSVNNNAIYGNSLMMSHSYNTISNKLFTATVYAIDSDGRKSSRIKIQVKVQGSQASIPIKEVSLGDIAIAKDPCAKSRSEGRSVDKATGAENFSITPLKVTGLFDLPFTLQYSSLLLSSGDISKGWSHNYHFSSYLEIKQNNGSRGDINVYWDNSAKKYNEFNYDLSTDNHLSDDKATLNDILTKNSDDTFTLKRESGAIYQYNRLGYLTSIANYKDQEIEMTFDDDGRLTKVKEPESRVFLSYYYNEDGTLDRVKDSLGRIARLSYNDEGLLDRVAYPDDTDHYFKYNDNEQIYKYEIRKRVDGIVKKVQVFYLYYIDDARVSAEEDSNNNLSRFAYEKIGDKIHSKFLDKAHGLTKTVYDDTNFNVYEVEHPDGTKESFTYYSKGKKKSWKNRAGKTTTYAYDTYGNLDEVVYHDNSEERYTYDINRNITKKTIIDKSGIKYVTRNEYDSDNNLKKSTLPNGDVLSYSYDSNNQMIKKTIGGKTTQYEYTKGRLSIEMSSLGLTTIFTYDKAGRMTTETNHQNKVTTYTYDEMDRVKTIKNPMGKTRTFNYDLLGNKIQETDFLGNLTTFEYDDNSNVLKRIDALGNQYKFTYDSADRLSTLSDPLGNKTTYKYDSMGRVSEVIDARGNTITYSYDAMGNLKSQTNAYGRTLFINKYDEKNNLIESIDILNRKTMTDYTIFGKPSKVIDPLGRATDFKYDKVGRLIEAINAKGKAATQDFTPIGTIKDFTDTGGSQTSFTYDDDGNLLTISTGSGSTTANSYAKGLLVSTRNGRQDVKTFKYDDLGRVIEAKDRDGTIVYTYDDNSNLKTIIENGKTITYTHDKLNRVTSHTNIFGETIRYQYNAIGNLIRLTYPNGKKVEYQYDGNSNLVEVKGSDLRTTYEYDKNNRLVKIARPNGTVLLRDYNEIGQLLSQTDKTSDGAIISSMTLEYDDVGNIIKEERVPRVKPISPVDINMSYIGGNLLDASNQANAQFDTDDNMISLDADSYVYDSRNRLIQNAANTRYSYDSQNYRTSQTIDGQTTRYTINSEASLSQLLTLIEPGGNKTFYTYGLGLLSQEKDGKRLYYHYDLRGSTIALTDKDGNIVDRFSYLPFGGQISHDIGTTQTPFLYNGRDGVMSDESGLYYMRARYYDPNIRRFINRDTLLGDVGEMASLNRFGYVNGNPVNLIDPSGNISLDIQGFSSSLFDQMLNKSSKINFQTWSGWQRKKVIPKYFGKAKQGTGASMKQASKYTLVKNLQKMNTILEKTQISVDTFKKQMNNQKIHKQFLDSRYMREKADGTILGGLKYIVENDARFFCGMATSGVTFVNSYVKNTVGLDFEVDINPIGICYPKEILNEATPSIGPTYRNVDPCNKVDILYPNINGRVFG